ncbi:MAG: hypothetical protein OXC02_06915 [Rhodobacteraceae bacterium]|nr:hypothetical protein [Paracoccaceae bacterium]
MRLSIICISLMLTLSACGYKGETVYIDETGEEIVVETEDAILI